MKKLGLGIQDFSDFRTHNFIYVDKTERIYKLIDDGKYYFLSRPRRFGKSLLVDTMKELLSGNKDLFEGCWVHDRWNWENTYPVIKLSFAEMNYRELGLKQALDDSLLKLAEEHDIRYTSLNYADRFLELIDTLGRETPMAVLIDEYDKPIIDYLERAELQQARENREILKTLYAGVKDQDKYLRFFFLTGVSKFSKVSIFSDLNHLTDITISKHFADIVGYSEAEITTYYAPYLSSLSRELHLSEAGMMKQIASWYDGYSWDGHTFLYNPYSILNLLYQHVFRNFWFETGTPTFLITHLKEQGGKLNQAINKPVDESAFHSYDVENLNITAIMFQTGYLTLKAIDYVENTYLLDFPNKEVRDSFLKFAVKQYANSSPDEMEYIVESLLEALEQHDMQKFLTSMQSLFASITVKQLEKVKEYEGFYHSIIFIVLKMLGIHVTCEVQSHFGTTDAVIMTDDAIFVVEFKMGTAQAAIEQIKKKQYHAPYRSDTRKLFIVGFGINKAARNLEEVISETIEHECP